MSHRITVSAEVTDQQAAERACKDHDWKYRLSGSQFLIQGGPLGGSFFNLKTGEFSGDSDLHAKPAIDAFLQAYSEAQWMNRIEQESGYLEERTVLQDGTIRLVANVMVA